MTFRDLKLRLRALLTPSRVERDLHDELSFHIECETRKLIDGGMPAEQARARARARFGSVTVVGDECRDQRGTSFVDNTSRDVRFALRSFRRAPLAAFTIVATVAIGLGVVATLFTILNTFLFRVDAVPDVERMYVVQRSPGGGAPSLFTRSTLDALRKETAVFADAYGAVQSVAVRVDGRLMKITLATGNFFDVVRVSPVMGRAFAQADDATGASGVIVLSDRGWRRHFDRNPGVLGRTVLVGGAPFEIVGVMPAGFRGLELSAPDGWAPLAQLGQFEPDRRGREDSAGLDVIGRLRPDISMESGRSQLSAWDSNRQTRSASPDSGRLLLQPKRGVIPEVMQAMAVFTPLFFVFGLILVIGCANVANLLLARALARAREIGIRLSLGASRRRIIRQLLTESWLLALVAAGAGYVLSRLALGTMFYWATRTLPVDLGDPNIDLSVPASDWRVAVFLVVAAAAATGFFALMPALQATRIDPVRTLRGELVKDARPGAARSALIGVQVFASALLLICAAIFLRSAIASSRFNPGFRTIDTLVIDVVNEPKRAAMIQEIASDTTIAAYAAMRPGVLNWPFEGFAAIGASRTAVDYKLVSPEYFGVFDIPIVRGRTFTAAERDGEYPVAIVSESAARELWPNGSGVGESFRLEPDYGPAGPPPDAPLAAARVVTVVGVARDIAGFRITDVPQAGIFLPASVKTPRTSIAARVTGNVTLAHRTLIDRLTKVDPNMGMIVTLQTLAGLEAYFLQVAFWVAVVLGGLALLLTVSGLFSVLSYLVEGRTREIGVRMALGASSAKVSGLILSQTARPVAYGLLAGAGLAASLATALLAMPDGARIAAIVHVTDPVAYAASLLAIIVACILAGWIPARRAASLDPMRALRQE